MSINYQFVGRLLQRPIAFHRVFADVADGSISAGLFLSQLYYWSDKGRDSEGWIYKTFGEWQTEIGIGRKSFEKARKILKSKGILEEQRKGLDPRLHYRLSLEALYEAISSLDNDPQSPEPPGFPNVQKEHCLMSERNIAQCPKGTLPNVLLADASYIQRIQTENTNHNSPPDAQERGGGRAYLCDSKSKENPEPETAADRGQDCDIKPLRKAEVIQNPEPETALQDCPSQPIGTQAKTFRNSEQNLSGSAETTQKPSTSNSNLEETNIPPAAAKISGVEAASTLAKVSEAITPKSSGLTARFSQEEQETLIDEAIDTYNQFRGSWGSCEFLSDTARNSLRRKILSSTGTKEQRRETFLGMVRDATLWCGRSEYMTEPGFRNKHFNFLIGKHSDEDRIPDYASQWRSLPEQEMVGTAIKITQDSAEKTYCGLDGKPTKRTWARVDWKQLSRRAKAGEEITQAEKDWANYYFPEYDIYLEHEDI